MPSSSTQAPARATGAGTQTKCERGHLALVRISSCSRAAAWTSLRQRAGRGSRSTPSLMKRRAASKPLLVQMSIPEARVAGRGDWRAFVEKDAVELIDFSQLEEVEAVDFVGVLAGRADFVGPDGVDEKILVDEGRAWGRRKRAGRNSRRRISI